MGLRTARCFLANAVFPDVKSRPLKTSVLMPCFLGHYVPLRFLSERERSDFRLERRYCGSRGRGGANTDFLFYMEEKHGVFLFIFDIFLNRVDIFFTNGGGAVMFVGQIDGEDVTK
jgi:hypothetical protein